MIFRPPTDDLDIVTIVYYPPHPMDCPIDNYKDSLSDSRRSRREHICHL